MKYKMFVSDFDGTLVRDDGTVSRKNKEVVLRYTQKGGIFAVCTGRMTPSILPRVRELGLNGLVASFQGAVVTDIRTGNTLRCSAFEDDLAYRVTGMLEERGYHTHIYTADKMYCNVADEALAIYERVCGVKAEIVPDLEGFARKNALKIIKAVVFVEKEQRAETEETLAKLFGAACYVTSSAHYLVEVMPAGRNKGEGLAFLSKYYGIPPCEIAAIGDMNNDIPLVAAAGGKFAVANAEEGLKRIACVVPACEDDGVAYALEHYAMEEDDHE